MSSIKRKRLDDSASNETTDMVKRSTQFWFHDGSVVLQAEDTQFRVHDSVLSLHSEIMKDCFSCPQPEDEPKVEGCPVVHLSDLAKDIENMCALLYAVYRYVFSLPFTIQDGYVFFQA